MAKTITPLQVPYDDNGNLMHYPDPWRNPQFRDAQPFTDTLTYAGFERRQSAACFLVKDSVGHEYPIFLKDMDEVLRTIGVTAGATPTATWVACKRGQNYGLSLAAHVPVR